MSITRLTRHKNIAGHLFCLSSHAIAFSRSLSLPNYVKPPCKLLRLTDRTLPDEARVLREREIIFDECVKVGLHAPAPFSLSLSLSLLSDSEIFLLRTRQISLDRNQGGLSLRTSATYLPTFTHYYPGNIIVRIVTHVSVVQELDEAGPLDLERVARAVEERDGEVEEVGLAQVGRGHPRELDLGHHAAERERK